VYRHISCGNQTSWIGNHLSRHWHAAAAIHGRFTRLSSPKGAALLGREMRGKRHHGIERDT